MRTTCIKHPEDQPLIMIKAWQVYATDGNHCAAALLSFFEYWHNVKAEERRKRIEEGKKVYDQVYQYQTDEDLRAGLLGLYNTNTIREALLLLENKKFLTITKNPDERFGYDKKKYFIFHPKKVNEYLENEYPQNVFSEYSDEHFMKEFVYTESEKRKKGIENGVVKNNDSSVNFNSSIVKNHDSIVKINDAITEITSETSPEITSCNTWSSQSSDNSTENSESLKLYKPETVQLSGKQKKLTKRDIVNQKANDPAFLQFFSDLRGNYQLFKGNKYLNHFGTHKDQFYKTLAYRVAAGHVNTVDIETAFQHMTRHGDFSIIQFLEKLLCSTYDIKKLLVDFIWIMLDGKVSAPTGEKKGAKELAEWLEDGKVVLTEIEDCFFWMPTSGRSYKMSLLSLKSALSEFDRVKYINGNGRYKGKSLNSAQTKDEKTVEILMNRDYNAIAQAALVREKEEREIMDNLIRIAEGKS